MVIDLGGLWPPWQEVNLNRRQGGMWSQGMQTFLGHRDAEEREKREEKEEEKEEEEVDAIRLSWGHTSSAS